MPSASRELLLKRANLLLNDLNRALRRLDEALKQPENDFVRDAAIQRFEFCFELAWKAIQAVARLEGQDCASPRSAFSVAWRNEWIHDEAAWLNMLDDRNKTSHTYRESMAKEVFDSLNRHLPQLNDLETTLVSRVRVLEMQTLEPPPES
jgi:nucleotidyltransferase substrate binding protein (TIGR01987 family)